MNRNDAVNQALSRAVADPKAGRPAEAESACRRLLTDGMRKAAVIHLLGDAKVAHALARLLLRLERFDEAEATVRARLATSPREDAASQGFGRTDRPVPSNRQALVTLALNTKFFNNCFLHFVSGADRLSGAEYPVVQDADPFQRFERVLAA